MCWSLHINTSVMSQGADIDEHFTQLHTHISRHGLSEPCYFMHYYTDSLFSETANVRPNSGYKVLMRLCRF